MGSGCEQARSLRGIGVIFKSKRFLWRGYSVGVCYWEEFEGDGVIVSGKIFACGLWRMEWNAWLCLWATHGGISSWRPSQVWDSRCQVSACSLRLNYGILILVGMTETSTCTIDSEIRCSLLTHEVVGYKLSVCPTATSDPRRASNVRLG